ncbi:protein RUFY3 isoform X3 [Agrilus planipennis]|uniref:Protein RUFY3 isoform X3 n=1 Tax=Agrilus planipennis TaxID=224129 RepID=A0A1W4XE76_AGRPL|nr:protein RUFY3 isoform X3 [Agrilus planipennis]
MVEVTNNAMEQDMAGAQDTIYLCNFRVSVDGEWLCLKELQDVEFNMQNYSPPSPDVPIHSFGRDPVAIERSNLLNISKLVVKELIEQSLRYGRMLDSDHMPLQHFFIVLEHVLRHGLRLKKGLLGPRKELWDILQLVEKYAPEAQDITSSVRDLPTVRTHMGRARAWLRLALMQKKLADYLKVLIDHKDETLVEFYEPDALMLSDEVIIIIGLLVGLNVIDCNLCVKEEDLDCPQGVIDFSLYLRSSNQVTEEENNEEQGDDNMITVLDQKSYMEELNRHLNATVTNLQSKVESLTTENALIKEDLSITKNSLYNIYEENRLLRKELGKEDPGDKKQNSMKSKRDSSSSSDNNEAGARNDTVVIEDLKKQLEEEHNARQEAEKELDLQMCLKAEMEVAMKLLEKDIHEKQDTIISLRRQLEEIKLINLEMYKKLQECEVELTQKGEMVSRLQAKAGQIGKILNNLEKYNHLIKEAEHDKKHCDRKVLDRKRMSLPKSLSKDSCLKIVHQQKSSLPNELNENEPNTSSVNTGNNENATNLNQIKEMESSVNENVDDTGKIVTSDSKDDVSDFEIVNAGNSSSVTPEVEEKNIRDKKI